MAVSGTEGDSEHHSTNYGGALLYYPTNLTLLTFKRDSPYKHYVFSMSGS